MAVGASQEPKVSGSSGAEISLVVSSSLSYAASVALAEGYSCSTLLINQQLIMRQHLQ